MKFGFIGPSYTAKSNTVADEECINLFAETNETPDAQTQRSYFGTPGLERINEFPESPTRGSYEANGRVFFVSGTKLYELLSDFTFLERGTVGSDGKAVSIAFNSIQLLIVSNGHAFNYELATDTLTDVTGSLVPPNPIQVVEADTYFIVIFADSNKFQISDPLDGTTWPGLQVNEVSVFPENITSISVNHRELWVFGQKHTQPYQDTGSDNIFDVIPGALIEKGNAATFSTAKLDNSVFWVDEDERGARGAWRSNGYTPQRISTHAVEIDLQSYDSIAGLVSYAYQDGGHLFWVLYVPDSSWSWVYDVGEQMWHKRAYWLNNVGPYTAHRSWNHVYAFGKHIVGDWNSGIIYEMHMPIDHGDGSYSFVTDNGNLIRRPRRSPTINNELNWMYHRSLTIDFATGLGPQPPLTDGDGNPRPPQVMLRWSDNGGSTWSSIHHADCGFAGEYNTRVIFRRLGRARRRVYEVVVTDPIPWAITDAYLDVAQ